jgi:hypothetical protein
MGCAVSITTTLDAAWEKRALKSINGQLPADISREELEEAIWHLEEEGRDELNADEVEIINRVVSFQSSGNEGQDLTTDPEPESAQEGVEAPQAVIETGRNENAPTGQPEATVSEPNHADAPPTNDMSSQQKKPEELTEEEVEKLLAEGKELPVGWKLTEDGRLIPPGYRINSAGFLMKEQSKEELKEVVEDLQSTIKSKKTLARHLGKNLSKLKPEAKAACEAQIAGIKAEVELLEEDLKITEQVWRAAPVDDGEDENQPWFGKVYANCRNFYVKMDDGTYKELSVEAASGFLKEWGISSRPDTQTTSPLDRAKNAIHNRHSVDWALALAGYQPGIKDLHGGKKVLITRGPELLKPEPGDYPIITKFLNGLLSPPKSLAKSPSEDQVVYFKGWAQHAVRHLYAGKIKKGQCIVFAGPIDSGKSGLQNLIITPLLGGRVARPYAFIVGRTDFNEEWFESEHLMLEDETPPRDYETQQLVAAGLKSLSANDDQWCHGKGKKAVTLPPFWRVSVSVNDNPEALRVLPINDPALKDKMIVLKAYPDATKELVNSLGGQDAFAGAIRAELPHILYDLLNVFEIPDELRDTRYDMKAYQNEEILEAVEETAPHIYLLEFMRKTLYSGVKDLFKTALEIHQDLDLKDMRPPPGVAPKHPNTLGKYLSSIAEMGTGEVVKKKTKGENGYILNFPEIGRQMS